MRNSQKPHEEKERVRRERTDGDVALPWFPLYVKDWIASESVTTMSWAEQGLFMRLLCHQWDNDGLPGSEAMIAKAVGASPSEFRRLWGAVGPQFPLRPDGRRANAILARHRADQVEKRHKRAAAGQSGGNAKASNARAALVANDYQPESETEPETDIEPVIGTLSGRGLPRTPEEAMEKLFALLPASHQTDDIRRETLRFMEVQEDRKAPYAKPTFREMAKKWASRPPSVLHRALSDAVAAQYADIYLSQAEKDLRREGAG